MKRFIILVAMAVVSVSFVSTKASLTSNEVCVAAPQRSVVFRTTQRLKTNDGWEIVLYTNRTAKIWCNGESVVATTYYLEDGEVVLMESDGSDYCKGSYRLKSDGLNISYLDLNIPKLGRKRFWANN